MNFRHSSDFVSLFCLILYICHASFARLLLLCVFYFMCDLNCMFMGSFKRFIFLLSCWFLWSQQLLFSQDLKLTLSDTVVCEGSAVSLTAEGAELSNLTWEILKEGDEDFHPFSSAVRGHYTYTLDTSSCCFRLSSVVDNYIVYSNVECVEVVPQYKPQWHKGETPIQSGHQIEVCGVLADMSFTINRMHGYQAFYENSWLIDDEFITHDTFFVIPLIDKDCVVKSVMESNVCKSDTFVFNFKTLSVPVLDLKVDVPSGSWLCLGDSVNIVAQIDSGVPLRWRFDECIPGWVCFGDDAEYSEVSDGKPSRHVLKPTRGSVLSPPDAPTIYTVDLVAQINVGGVKCRADRSLYYQVEEPYQPFPLDTLSICNGEALKLDLLEEMEKKDHERVLVFSNYSKVSWYVDDQFYSEGFTLNLDGSTLEGTKLTQVVEQTVCPTVTKDYVISHANRPHVTLSSEKGKMCVGDTVSLLVQTDNATKLEWQQVDNWGEFQTFEFTNVVDRFKMSPSLTSKYRVKASLIGCETTSDVVEVEVQYPVEVTLSSNLEGKQVTLCRDDEAWFEAGVIINHVNSSDVVWRSNGKDIYRGRELSVRVDGPTQYELWVKNEACPAYTDTFFVDVVDNPSLSVENVMVCEGDSAVLEAHYDESSDCRWFAGDGTLLGEGSRLSLLPDGEMDCWVEISRNSDHCSTKKSVVVSTSSLPVVIGHEKINDTKYQLNTSGGTGELSFEYGAGAISHDVLDVEIAHEYHVEVVDERGCRTSYDFHTDGYELEIPPYFVASRENWLVGNLDRFEGAVVEIFDRAGKLLLRSRDFSMGWDGMYNGVAMPSTDYWYVITFSGSGRQITGHFTLLRES